MKHCLLPVPFHCHPPSSSNGSTPFALKVKEATLLVLFPGIIQILVCQVMSTVDDYLKKNNFRGLLKALVVAFAQRQD